MARTIEQITAEIYAKIAEYPSLSVLTNTSSTSRWRLFVNVAAFVIWQLENLFDILSIEIDERIARAKPPTGIWLVEQCYAFQYGYPLIVDDGVLKYATIDDSAKIIKRASIKKETGFAQLKVATIVDDTVQALTPAQMTAFTYYVNDIIPPGSNIQLISLDADWLWLSFNVYYNPLYLVDDVRTRVIDAIEAHLASVRFDGFFVKSAIVDAVQAVAGVNDVDLYSFQAKPDGATDWITVPLRYQAQAGHAIVSPDNTLIDNINLIPQA